MARFIRVPPFTIGRPGNWVLADDLVYRSDIVGRVTVPGGFESDLASIPPLLPDFVFRKNGRHRLAAVVHDWLCRSQIVQRKTADRVFLEAMELLQESAWRRYVMYGAVRLYSGWLRLRGKA